MSYSSWELGGRVARVSVRLSGVELSRLGLGPAAALPGALDPWLAAYLTERLRLRAGAAPCRVDPPPRALAAGEGFAAVEWTLRCDEEGPLVIESALFRDTAPQHLHFARVREAGAGLRERVLRAGDAVWRLEAEPKAEAAGTTGSAAGSSLADYVALGVRHIAGGWDHLAFLLALVLLARRLGELATIVTGFTVAHSVTLALAVLGALRPDPAAVEALIGLSIALVAAENAWHLSGGGRIVPRSVALGLGAAALAAALGAGAVPAPTLAGLALFAVAYFALLERVERPVRLRVAVAFAFGLVHGFGFAGVLAELELPPARLGPALLGFNAGVELGQLAVVAALWPLLRALARWRAGRPHRLLVETASAGLCGLGLFWFATRTYG